MSWNVVNLENTAQPKYLGVTFDRTLSYKQHIHNTRMKVATRNNPLKKVVSSKCGTNTSTTKTTALTMCYSIIEYIAPVWARSSHADILDPKLNKACRGITGCLKPIYLEDNLLAGFVPPNIKNDMYARMERTKPMEQQDVSLIGHIPASSYDKCKPSYFHPKAVRCNGRGDQGTSCA